VYLCQAPKSNAVYAAYGAALKDVQDTRNEPVPLHLRNAPTGLMKGLGYGKGYEYAHDIAQGRSDQQHLPDNLEGRIYYEPTNRGFEAGVRERLAWREEAIARRAQRHKVAPRPAPSEEIAPGEESQVVVEPEREPIDEPDGPDIAAQVRPAKKPGKK
jgi:putative ATPase